MPQVPRLTQAPVELGQLQVGRVSTEAPVNAFGGGTQQVAQAGASAIGEAQGIVQKEVDRANENWVLEKRRAYNEWEYQKIYDPDTGAVNRLGKDALGLHEELQADMDKFYETQYEDAHNDQQRAALAGLNEARRDSTVRWADNHVGKQVMAMEAAEYDASLESSKERGSANPDHAPMEAEFIKNRVNARAERLGWTPEQTKQNLQEAQSDLHYRVINKMLVNQQDQLAMDYFKGVKKGMDPDVATKTTAILEEATMRGESQRVVDDMLAKNLPPDQVQEKLRALGEKNPKLRDATKSRYEDELSTRDRIARAQSNQRFDTSMDELEKSKGKYEVPEAAWLDMDNGQRKEFEARKKQLNEGIEPAANGPEYYNLTIMASTHATQDKFLGINLQQMRSQVTQTEMSKLIDLQNGLRNRDEKTLKELDGYRTNNQIVNDTLNAINIDPTPKPGSKPAERADNFRQQVDAEIQSWQLANGKKAPNDVVQKIVNDLGKKVVLDRGLIWDTTKPVFELTPADVPEADRQKISSALRARNRPVTDSEIFRYYLLKVQNGR